MKKILSKDVDSSTCDQIVSDYELFDDLNSHPDKTIDDEPIYNEKIDRVRISDTDVSFVMHKVEQLTTEEAIELAHQIISEYQYDLNFNIETLNKLKDLVKGAEYNNMPLDEYDYELKSQTAVIKYFSPYPEVRAVTEPFDDPSIPVETIRSVFLGYLLAVIGQFVNSFFLSRFPNITITSSVCQLLLYPCGLFFAWALPDWGFYLNGTRHSLNPGPWSFKEQTFSTIIFNVSLTSAYAFFNIQTQEVLFKDTWIDVPYKMLIILSTQFLGLGFAGLLRRFVVYPVETFWPVILPTLALNKSLLSLEKKEKINGWTISRYKFFFICFVGMSIYYWFPAYLFQSLSYFTWMTWISPENFNLAVVTGSQIGLGFNPIPTFDWNIINLTNPLAVPFFSTFQQYLGSILSGIAILWIYYTNAYNTGYLQINSSSIFTNTGEIYDVSKVMTNGKLDELKYSNYSPPFYTAGSLVQYSLFFACYSTTFIYVSLDKWRSLLNAGKIIYKSSLLYIKRSYIHTKIGFSYLIEGNIIESCKEFSKISQDATPIYEGFDDPFTKMISKYPEVPEWWFFSVVLFSVSLAIVLLTCYPDLNTPVWAIFLVIAVNFVFLVSIAYMSATTGISIGLNVLIELLSGYLLPSNAESIMFFKAYGFNLGNMADTYISDQKLAHYSKIPPRAVFRGQITSTFITSFVAYAVVTFVDNNVEGICTPEQTESFTCGNGSRIYFSSAVVWGLIGPVRIFSEQYPALKWFFLAGFIVSVLWWLIRNHGYLLRNWSERNLNSILHKVLNFFIFIPISFLYPIHPGLVCIGALNWAPFNLSYSTAGLYASLLFMWYLKKYKTSWWQKYNYVLSSAFTAGVAFSAIIIFFSVQYHSKPISWWGNDVLKTGVDGGVGRTAYITELPAKGYFGPDEWH